MADTSGLPLVDPPAGLRGRSYVRSHRSRLQAERFIELTESMGLLRGIGIGLHDGEVVAAPVGGEDRLDFTILGHAVNQSSRLCSAARRGEIVVSIGSLPPDDGGFPHTGGDEEIMLKGHQAPLIVRRIPLSEAANPGPIGSHQEP